MHTHRPVAALCILAFLFLLPCALAQAIPDPCFPPFTPTSTFTAGYSAPPLYNPYPCILALSNAAGNVGELTSLSITGDTCAAVLSDSSVGYGSYSCEMKPPGIAGTVMSCQVVSLTSANYESIFIKFIGNDTKRVYIGFVSYGNAYMAGPYPLPFDPTLEVHRYSFMWTSAYVIWYLDDKEISSNYGLGPIPRSPNKFMLNLVTEKTGGIQSDTTLINTDPTVGRDYIGTGTSADFRNVTYTPLKSVSCDGGGLDGGGGNVDLNACTLRAPLAIFVDEFTKGWNNGTSTSNSFTNSPVHSGTVAIAWDVIPGARINFLSPLPFSSDLYQTFQFWIYGNGYNGQRIGITMLFQGGEPSNTVDIATLLPGLGVQSYEWVRVVVPFSLFGISDVAPRRVLGFTLANLADGFGGTVRIDDVYLGFVNPPCNNESFVIYDDDLINGYKDLSWGTWNLRDSTRAQSGSYSIMWGIYGDAGSGLRFMGDSANTNTYIAISMWISIGTLQGWDWTIAMTSDGSTGKDTQIGAAVNIRNYYGAVQNLPRQVGQWSRIVIPFSEFGIPLGTSLDGIIFRRDDDAQAFQGTLYVDTIGYVRQFSNDPDSPYYSPSSSASQVVAGLLGIFALCVAVL